MINSGKYFLILHILKMQEIQIEIQTEKKKGKSNIWTLIETMVILILGGLVFIHFLL